ncbi:MAG: V-type ATPase subunit [Actinobacteria bacterium]|nr:V-type ATPase subunit [Actinomycetota bacterium]
MVRVDLSDYGYVNARVRGMRSHLLLKDFFMRLVEAEDLDQIHSLLDGTVYRREVNEAILMNPEKPDYDQAFNINMVNAFRRIHDATGGEARKLVGLILSRYDIQNIKSILRGKKGDALPSEITLLMVPVGNIRMDVLEDLIGKREIRDVISAMSNHGIKYARPLAGALNEYYDSEQDMAVLELVLDKYYYQSVMDSLQSKDENVEIVRQMFVGEIDMRNISTLVRIRGLRLEDYEVTRFYIAGGSLSSGQFLYLHSLGDIAGMVKEYPDRRYRKVLEKALEEYQELDVVAFDRLLEHEQVERGMGVSNLNVLGIGVIVGYIWAKQNEIINLRIVIKGKTFEQPQAEIRRELFFVERESSEG